MSVITDDVRSQLPAGAIVEVLLVDLQLDQARVYVPEGAGWWENTELTIRQAFSLTSAEYWAMTVAEHTAIAQHLHLENPDGRR